LFAISRAWSLQSLVIKIGRKHKAHRQQLVESKPRRNSEKSRGKGKGKGKRFNMGNEESRVVDPDTPTQTLRERSVEALAEYIKDGRAKQIVVMVSQSWSVSWRTSLTTFRRAQE
jgi:NAD-dependent histone deacetylase SIR2